jgi:pentatricopeptide repeat protein
MSDADPPEDRNEFVAASEAWSHFAAKRVKDDLDAQSVERWFHDNGGLESLAAAIRSRSRDPLSIWLARHARQAPRAIGPQPVRVMQDLYEAAHLPRSAAVPIPDNELSAETGRPLDYSNQRKRDRGTAHRNRSRVPVRGAVLNVISAYKEALAGMKIGADVHRLTLETRARLEMLQGEAFSRPHFAKSLSQMSTALRKKGWVEIALLLVEWAIQKGVIDSHILNDAAQCYLANGDMQSAERVLVSAREKALATDGMYAGILDRHARAGSMTRARELFDEAVMGGLAGDICYTALIDGYGKLGDLSEAEHHFAIARRLGLVSLATFTVLLDAHGKKGNLQRAQELFEEAKTLDSADRQPIHTALIDAYGKAGDWESAERVFKELRRYGTPCPHSFSALLCAHARAGNLRQAQLVFDEAKALGIYSPFSYLTLMKAYENAGCSAQAKILLDEANSERVWNGRADRSRTFSRRSNK